LHHQGTLVVAVHASFDTEMAALATNVPKASVVRQALDAVEAGQAEELADERSGPSRQSCRATTS
jgi:hypothetical protein